MFGFYIFDPNYSQGNTREVLEDFRPFINKEESQKAKERFEFHQVSSFSFAYSFLLFFIALFALFALCASIICCIYSIIPISGEAVTSRKCMFLVLQWLGP